MNSRVVVAAWLAIVLHAGCVGDSPSTSTTDGGPDASSDASQTALWVDPIKGEDSRPGNSSDAPLKTIKMALLLAKPGFTVNLAAGIYDAGSGEDWHSADSGRDSYEVPANVTITTPQKGGAVLSGTFPKGAFTVLAGAKMVNLKLKGFNMPLEARGGKLELVGVEVTQSEFQLLASDTAIVEGTGCAFTDSTAQNSAINAQGSSKVTFFQSTFTGLKMTNVVTAIQTSEVTLNGCDMRNNGPLLMVQGNAKAQVNDTKMQNNTGTAFQDLIYAGSSSATEAPEITLGNNTVFSDNTGGVRLTAMTGSAKLTLMSASLLRNGIVGVDMEGGATLIASNSTIADHTLNNIRCRKVSAVKEPVIQFNNQNTLKMSVLSEYSVEISCTGCTGSFLFGSTTWNPAPAPTGTINVTAQVLAAPHYRLDGSGYKVVF